MRVRAWSTCLLLMCASPAVAQPKPVAKGSKDCLDAYVAAQERKVERRLTAAKSSLEVCARASCPKDIARECSAWLAEVTRDTPTIALRAVDDQGAALPAARLSVDGRPATTLPAEPFAVDPGQHELLISAEGYADAHRSIDATLGTKLVVELRLVKQEANAAAIAPKSPTEQPSSERAGARRVPIDTWVWLGTGTLSAGLGTYFAITTSQRYGELDRSCRPTCAHDEVSSLRTRALVADVGIGLGVVLATVGIYRFASAPLGPTRVSFGPGSAAWGGHF